MKFKTPFDHKETGYSLAGISEKLLICLGEQFLYLPAQRQYRRITEHIHEAVSSIDSLRDYLCSIAYRELRGDLPYKFYYPSSHGIDFSTGLFAKTAGEPSRHRFDLRAEKRKQTYSDGEKTIPFSRKDRVDTNIWISSAITTITEISDQSRKAFLPANARKTRKLATEAIQAISSLNTHILRV
jgi:hypothetical protein